MPRMRLTLAELLDRYTIETRKHFYGHGNAQLIMEVEHEIYGQIANICVNREAANKMMSVVRAAAKLGVFNDSIASLEWQLRAGQNLSLEEHGRRARVIRYINDHGRVGAKHDLSVELEQNIETRHYGYGDLLRAEDLTLDVQEPAEMGKTISEAIGTASHPARVSSDVVDFTKSEFYR